MPMILRLEGGVLRRRGNTRIAAPSPSVHATYSTQYPIAVSGQLRNPPPMRATARSSSVIAAMVTTPKSTAAEPLGPVQPNRSLNM